MNKCPSAAAGMHSRMYAHVYLQLQIHVRLPGCIGAALACAAIYTCAYYKLFYIGQWAGAKNAYNKPLHYVNIAWRLVLLACLFVLCDGCGSLLLLASVQKLLWAIAMCRKGSGTKSMTSKTISAAAVGEPVRMAFILFVGVRNFLSCSSWSNKALW